MRTIAPESVVSAFSGSSSGSGVAGYLQSAHMAAVVAVAAIAVVMVIWGAVEVFGESVWGKKKGRERIWNAILGLLLAAGSYVILKTVSESLLSADFALSSALGSDASPTTLSAGSVTSSGGSTSGGASGGSNNYPSSGGGSGTIAQNSQSGLTFPNEDWNAYALQQVQNSGLLELNPSDVATYFPDGQVSAQGYVSLLAGIAKSESNFNTNDNVDHSHGTDVGNTYSVGLFSLTHTDSAWQRLGYSESDLADPQKQINAAVNILQNQISNTGSISGSSSNHYWGPLYRGE